MNGPLLVAGADFTFSVKYLSSAADNSASLLLQMHLGTFFLQVISAERSRQFTAQTKGYSEGVVKVT